jgi:hypothetical protein
MWDGRPSSRIDALLFQTNGTADAQVEQYAVASDGKRFLLPTPVGGELDSLVMVQNWYSELERLVPFD